MLQWETADEHADYSFERYREVSGKHEYRIFYGPEAATQGRPWILAVREIGETATAGLPIELPIRNCL
jgi:hypothetical protein